MGVGTRCDLGFPRPLKEGLERGQSSCREVWVQIPYLVVVVHKTLVFLFQAWSATVSRATKVPSGH